MIMEIKRKIYQKLLKWKEETNGTKALFLEGARRIGKSTIAKKFAQNEYESFVLIDFNPFGKFTTSTSEFSKALSLIPKTCFPL